MKIYKQIASNQQTDDRSTASDINKNVDVTNFDLFLEEDEFAAFSESVVDEDKKIYENISKCCLQSRIYASNENFDIFKYLQAKYSRDKFMLYTCLAVTAAPSSQSSVERAFSALRILLSHLRFNLSATSIQNILICRLNNELLQRIDYKF